jgi:CMP-N-acetylneuraminic acid synthetase
MEDTHPARMYTKDKQGIGHSLQSEDATRNRQELIPVYHRNGAIYIFDRSLVVHDRVISETPLLYEMEKKYSINIDDEVDWIFAEALCASLLKN